MAKYVFLRSTKRFKDGKEHRYWSVVENRRVSARHTVQKTLLYLGEINGTERVCWTRAIESVDESDRPTRINLFPEDRAPDPSIQPKLSEFDVLLYDLTSSYFEFDANGAVAQNSELKAYLERLKALRESPSINREELFIAIGAAGQKAGRKAYRLVHLDLPPAREPVTPDTFGFALDRSKLRETRLREGQYLLRSNLTGEDSAVLWKNYMNLVRIEESFRTLKSDLGLRPVHHQLDERIEAHIFISYFSTNSDSSCPPKRHRRSGSRLPLG